MLHPVLRCGVCKSIGLYHLTFDALWVVGADLHGEDSVYGARGRVKQRVGVIRTAFVQADTGKRPQGSALRGRWVARLRENEPRGRGAFGGGFVHLR